MLAISNKDLHKVRKEDDGNQIILICISDQQAIRLEDKKTISVSVSLEEKRSECFRSRAHTRSFFVLPRLLKVATGSKTF